MAEHSPLPWRQLKTVIDDANGHYVCRLFHPDSPAPGTTSNCGTRTECEANAAYIVTAANAFPELVAACQALLDSCESIEEAYESETIEYSIAHKAAKLGRAALKSAGVTDA